MPMAAAQSAAAVGTSPSPRWANAASSRLPPAHHGSPRAVRAAERRIVHEHLVRQVGQYRWTGLVLVALGARFAGRLFVALGGVAAVLILLGVFSFLALPAVDLANFVGYVLWSVWLLIFAAVLVRRGARQPSRASARSAQGVEHSATPSRRLEGPIPCRRNGAHRSPI